MKILIVRTSAMGDVVHALPVLTALRRHLPEAKIGWVVEESMAPLLQGHPDLEELLVVRLRHWRRSLTAESFGETRAFLSALNRFAADVVLDLMGNHKAGAISALTLADRRIGFARTSRREPSSAIWITQPVVPRGTHAVDRMLSLLDALDLPAEPADFGPEKLFREEAPAAIAGEEPFVLLHPGAGWANKRYPPAWWGEAARRIHEAAGVRTWVAVARGEEELAAGVQADGGEAVRLVPAPDLPALAALIRRARLMLGGDSGPTHLAHALGAPVLMLMGPTDPERSGPYGAPERALFRRLPCSFCYQRFAETKACLLEIPPRLVAERAAMMLRDAT
ncbi:MAG TPA: lipopolysaccharide heptosyltransferase I [Thermoanaerobaculia bacterium]|nr:lipopolysaccharide heptosyltransferase I [Thermoanaerobaculia bacterium]